MSRTQRRAWSSAASRSCPGQPVGGSAARTLVEARLAEGRVDEARAAAVRLDRIAETAGRDRVVATALLARGPDRRGNR